MSNLTDVFGRAVRIGAWPRCECGEQGMTPVEQDAGRCELCDRDRESRAALNLARGRAVITCP
jgi:hypothetical protein